MSTRLPVIDPVDRRTFCRWTFRTAAGLVLLGGCTGHEDTIETGGLGDDDLEPGVDGSPQSRDGGVTFDAAPPQEADAAPAASCPATPRDVGVPTTFAMNTATAFGQFFVVRDAAGLFAVTSQCTHRTGVTVSEFFGQFRCPRHGALFTHDGTIVSGPVTRGLVHYATCLLPNGHVGVSTSTTVASNVRLVA